MRKTTNIRTATPAILTPAIAPVFSSDLKKRDGDGDTEVGMIRLVSSFVDVMTDVAGKETGLLFYIYNFNYITAVIIKC